VSLLLKDPQGRADLVERGRIRSQDQTPAKYIGAICARLDAFAPIRRCWGRGQHGAVPGDQLISSAQHGSESARTVEDPDSAIYRDVIKVLRRRLETSETDRTARLNAIQTLQGQLVTLEADHADRLDVIHALKANLEESEADRAARLTVIHGLKANLEESEADRAARLTVIETLKNELDAGEADRAALADAVNALQSQLHTAETSLDQSRFDLEKTLARLDDIVRSRSWRWTSPARRATNLLTRAGKE
jgi:chromosome segregation ATPase